MAAAGRFGMSMLMNERPPTPSKRPKAAGPQSTKLDVLAAPRSDATAIALLQAGGYPVHMRRRLSSPSLSLFTKASLRAEEVDAAIDDQVRAKGGTMLRAYHPFLQQVRNATGINLVQVSRRSRNLLIEIEQHQGAGPLWQYRERTPRLCTFSCRGQLPATIEAALQGELLEKLVIPAAALEGITIASVVESGDGWLDVNVEPKWHLF